ncbi:MAG: DUF2325 domain-containing protein [Burkholderiales bacterium]|nr:DUF2325 domain-containing protein [Burkholderiales bacterium]
MAAKRQRRKLLDLDSHLHCSIVGTCLTVAELRRIVVRRLGQHLARESDLEIHEHGVRLASDAEASRELSRELDRKFELSIKRFGRADTEVGIGALWEEAKRSGDIPAGYWCLVTHPATSRGLLQRAVGDVHMLSHIVGASNRADIRRLAQLDERCGRLDDKVARQQARIQALSIERDAARREIGAALQCVPASSSGHPGQESQDAAQFLRQAVAALEQRLVAAKRRREHAEATSAADRAAVQRLEAQLRASAARERMLEAELQAAATLLEQSGTAKGCANDEGTRLAGCSVLYVGGRPGALHAMRAYCETRGCGFMHHDGGLEVRIGLLDSWIRGADLVVFPADCVSHDAALAVKRACRQAGRPFKALRSSGVTSFVAALECWEPTGEDEQAMACDDAVAGC